MSRWVFWGLVCGRWDSNPHALRRHPLKMVRLPVPPLPHEGTSEIDRQQKSYQPRLAATTSALASAPRALQVLWESKTALASPGPGLALLTEPLTAPELS